MKRVIKISVKSQHRDVPEIELVAKVKFENMSKDEYNRELEYIKDDFINSLAKKYHHSEIKLH